MRLSEVYRGYKEGSLPGLVGLSETARVNEFAAFLQRGMKTDLMNGYEANIGNVDAMFDKTTSDGAFETYAKLGALDMISELPETGEFPRIGFNSEDVRLVNKQYGGILEIQKYLIETDQTRAIAGQPRKMGESAAREKHYNAWQFYETGDATTCYDAVYIFAANGSEHPCVTGGVADTDQMNSFAAGALTEAVWETAISYFPLWKGIMGEYIVVKPVSIIVSTDYSFTAKRLFQDPIRPSVSAGADYGHNKNIHFNEVDVVVEPRLTATEYYIKTNILGFVNQTLTPLELEQEAENAGLSFDTRVLRYRVYEAYRLGCVEWRAAARVN